MHFFSFLTILFLVYLSSSFPFDDAFEQGKDIIKVTSPTFKGALVDSYSRQIIVIKLKSLSDVLKDIIPRIDLESMGAKKSKELLTTLGNVEMHYQKSFLDLLSNHQELIATPYPQKSNEGTQLLDVTSLRRQRRNLWKSAIAFLRAARPVIRSAGKLTKYGKFMKGIKYTGYVASAGIFAYEMADAFVFIPDVKYDEVTRQLGELHELRTRDLEIMSNVTLMTINTNSNIMDMNNEVSQILASAYDRFELMIRISQVFGSYMQQLSNSFILLMQGKIPSSLVSLELQRTWLEKKLPVPLLNNIGSITPNLEIKLKAIDEVNHQIIVTVEVPKVTSKFQILNYVYWEPQVIRDDICYTSPRKSLLLAYPPSSDKSHPPVPLLMDPESCLTDGYIMCEADSILEQIPLLSPNKVCTNEIRLINGVGEKRDLSDLYLQASSPINNNNISHLVNKTLHRNSAIKGTQDELIALNEEIRRAIIQSKKSEIISRELLDKAQTDAYLINILFMILVPLLLWFLYQFSCLLHGAFKNYKKRNSDRRRQRILSSIGEMSSS